MLNCISLQSQDEPSSRRRYQMSMAVMFMLLLVTWSTEFLVYGVQVEVLWWESPPYIYGNISHGRQEVFEAFKGMSRYGCNCTTLSFGPSFKNYAEFVEYLNNIGNKTTDKNKLRLFLPAFKHSVIKQRYRFGEFGLVKSPGMTLVTNRILKSKLYTLAVKGFYNARALIVVMGLIMFDVGIIVWIIEGHLYGKNKDFRPGFLPGVWDAVWWAAVTMTTVGYGDKTPKSNLGRLVGLFWLIMSAALMAGFTAMMTSSLDGNAELATRKVVVLNKSIESEYVEEKRGEKVVEVTYEQALERAVSLDVVGVLLDTNVVAYFQERLFEKGLGLQQSIEKEQNVTILYLNKERNEVEDAKRYIECMERGLITYAAENVPVLKAERSPNTYEILLGIGASVNVFFYFYISSGVLLFLGILVELRRLMVKPRKVSQSCCDDKEGALEMVATKPTNEPDQLKLLLEELRIIKATLEDFTANRPRPKTAFR